MWDVTLGAGLAPALLFAGSGSEAVPTCRGQPEESGPPGRVDANYSPPDGPYFPTFRSGARGKDCRMVNHNEGTMLAASPGFAYKPSNCGSRSGVFTAPPFPHLEGASVGTPRLFHFLYSCMVGTPQRGTVLRRPSCIFHLGPLFRPLLFAAEATLLISSRLTYIKARPEPIYTLRGFKP